MPSAKLAVVIVRVLTASEIVVVAWLAVSNVILLKAMLEPSESVGIVATLKVAVSAVALGTTPPAQLVDVVQSPVGALLIQVALTWANADEAAARAARLAEVSRILIVEVIVRGWVERCDRPGSMLNRIMGA